MLLKSLVALAAVVLVGGAADAQTLSGPALAAALKHGGYVLLMRHASSPMAIPDKALAEPDNLKPERQLDDEGKATAQAMGQALKTLAIPVGRVESSPTYRALQTARLAGLPAPETFVELGDNGASMQAQGAAQGGWLRARTAEAPRPGTDTIIITHLPNIRIAYPDLAALGVADGEVLAFRPDGHGGSALVGRIRIEDWPALAAAAP